MKRLPILLPILALAACGMAAQCPVTSVDCLQNPTAWFNAQNQMLAAQVNAQPVVQPQSIPPMTPELRAELARASAEIQLQEWQAQSQCVSGNPYSGCVSYYAHGPIGEPWGHVYP